MGNKKLGEDEVRGIIREELEKIVKELIQGKLSYELKFEPSDILYMAIKNTIEESLGNSKHLRDLHIESLLTKVLKDLLQPKLEGLEIKLDMSPKLKGG